MSKVIPINKVIKEIEERYYDDIFEKNGKDLNSNFGYNFALTTCIQIIKDNIKEIDDNDKYDKIAERILDKFLNKSIVSHNKRIWEQKKI